MPDRVCLFRDCKKPIPAIQNKRRIFCGHECAVLAYRDRQYTNRTKSAPAHVLEPNVIHCNHCNEVMASPRALREHKQAIGLTRAEEAKSQIGSSLDGINA